MNQLEYVKKELEDLKDKANKANVQEEFFLNQLFEKFECETIDEAKDLLSQLTEEKEELNKKINIEENELYKALEREGLV